MKSIYHLAENITLESGGLRSVLVNLNNYILENKKFSSVVVTNKKEKDDLFIDFPSTKLKSWCYAAELKDFLYSTSNDIDLMHLHGVFMHAQYVSSKLAKKNNIPYVITPHGMLEPWHLNDKKTKKEIYLALVLKSILSKSKVLHAITPIEKENLYRLTNHKNIIEIPNFIHLSDLPTNTTYSPREEYLLFLSRLHSKKGLDILIQSMSKIDNKKIKLKIVGTENEYSSNLKKLTSELGISNRIEFLGGVYGDEKYNLFTNAKAFIAPSYSEAIGMVNLEAAACKTPVITTFNTGISPEWNLNGGIMINPNVEELTKSINAAVSWSAQERNERGITLSDFVKNNYSWERKGYLWNDLYNSL